jgi:hypothetical protein
MIRNFPISISSRRLLALAATALLHTVSARGASIAPNTSFNPGVAVGSGTNIIATGSLFGTVLADETISFAESFGPYFTGTIRSLVVRRADTLTLDFYYQLVNTTAFEEFPNDADIFGLSVDNFGGFGFPSNDALDLIFRTDGLTGLTGAGSFVNGTVGAVTGNREPAAPGSIGFVFATDSGNFFDDPNNLAKGERSDFLVVRSNAADFANAPAFVMGTFGTATTQAFAPVPEPGVAGLTAFGVLALSLRRRRTAS